MSIETRTVPCRHPGCRHAVLIDNDQWHLHLQSDGTFRFLLGHVFGGAPEPTLPSGNDEEIWDWETD